MTTEGLIVLIPSELEAGFRLAGVETVAAEASDEAIEILDGLIAESSSGVIAVYQHFLEKVPEDRMTVYDASLSPVVVSLPAGLEEHDDRSHRVRISAILSRAVGYHITFGEEMS